MTEKELADKIVDAIVEYEKEHDGKVDDVYISHEFNRVRVECVIIKRAESYYLKLNDK